MALNTFWAGSMDPCRKNETLIAKLWWRIWSGEQFLWVKSQISLFVAFWDNHWYQCTPKSKIWLLYLIKVNPSSTSYYLSKHVRSCQNTSKHVRTCQNASERVKTRQNASKTRQNELEAFFALFNIVLTQFDHK